MINVANNTILLSIKLKKSTFLLLRILKRLFSSWDLMIKILNVLKLLN